MVQGESKATIAHRKPLDEEIDVFGLTHVGKKRKVNEDQFLICSLHKLVRMHGTSLPDFDELSLTGDRLAFFGMVADGVGGAAAGDKASQAAVETVATYVTKTLRCYYTADAQHEPTFLMALEEAVRESHESVLARAVEHPELRGMATTLTLAMGVWPRSYIVQVGDSRGYRLRDEELQQITRDQTVAQELADQGAITQTEAHRSPLSNILSSAIGGSEAKPVISKLDFQWNDVLLLCSDGLTKHVSDDEIQEQLVRMESAEQVCQALLGDALDGGGSDNITIVVGRAQPS